MPRVGYSSSNANKSFSTSAYADWQEFSMPENGWISRIGVLAWMDSGSPRLYQLGLWNSTGNLVFESNEVKLTQATEYRERNVSGVRMQTDDQPKVGIWYSSGSSPGRFGTYQKSGLSPTFRYAVASGIPAKLPAGDTDTTNPEALACFFEYVANAKPSMPVVSSPANGAQINNTSAMITCSLPHATSENGFDTTSQYQIEVYNHLTSARIASLSGTYTTTNAERSNGSFSRTLSGLTAGNTYRYTIRHQDSWGVWSDYNTARTFTVAEGPEVTAKAPSGKINVRSGYSYVAGYTSEQNRSANAYEIEVYPATGSTALYTSGTVTKSVANNTDNTVTEFHTDLAWATAYRWRTRMRDTAGLWSAWTPMQAFRTNATPTAPTVNAPDDNVVRDNPTFTATHNDPDGDPVSAMQIEMVRVSDSTTVAGYPKTMTVDTNTGVGTITPPLTDFAGGQSYRWRVRSTDGYESGYGPYSGYRTFLFNRQPVVTLVNPAPSGRMNRVTRPNAELAVFDSTSGTPYFTLSGTTTGGNAVEQYQNPARRTRNLAYRATVNAGTTLGLTGVMQAVDATKPYLYGVEARKDPGSAATATHIFVECYNGSGTLLGTVYPTAFLGANGVDLTGARRRYGGTVFPAGSSLSPAFPSGTTQVKLRIDFARSPASTATVYVDDVQFEDLPPLSDLTPYASAGGVDSALNFYGYADGSTLSPVVNQSEGEVSTEAYTWYGETNASESHVLPVIDYPGGVIHIAYDPLNSPKASHRVVVERFDGFGWVSAGEPEWVTSTALTATLPSRMLQNNSRVRIKVEVKDTYGADGETAWREADVIYTGPPEPEVTLADGDRARGEIVVEFTVSDENLVPAASFLGYEFAIESEEPDVEPLKVYSESTDQSTRRFVYPYPVNGRPYLVYVRQVATVADQQVEGEWAAFRVVCDYRGLYFLKDTRDPENAYIAFAVPSGALPSYTRSAPNLQAVALRGQVDPVHFTDRIRSKAGDLTIRLKGRDGTDQSVEERIGTLEAFDADRPILCLMMSEPEEKHYVKVRGQATFAAAPFTDRRIVSFSWRETGFEEDIDSPFREADDTPLATNIGLIGIDGAGE